MAEKGLNQKELCNKAKLNPSTLSNFLNCKTNISARSASKIATALDRELKELFEFKIFDKRGD